MPGISIHVVDASRGIVAAGMRVEMFSVDSGLPPHLIASGTISKTGTLNDPALDQRFAPGFYEAHFHVAGGRQVAARCDLDLSRRSRSGEPPEGLRADGLENVTSGILRLCQQAD